MKFKIVKEHLIFLCLCFAATSCYRVSPQVEPCLPTPCHPKEIAREERKPCLLPENFSVSPFPPLSGEEACQDWGKEYRIALVFAEDFDLYRAITSFKRALVLLPPENLARRQEIEYGIALSYFLGKKYGEVIYEVESSGLFCADDTFPAFLDLLVILYESYYQLGRCAEWEHILSLIEARDCLSAERLSLLQALREADFEALSEKKKESVDQLFCEYRKRAKSVVRAEFLNAILPGAGYWYVGQRETAITAFLVNSLFIGAAVAFFENGNVPAGVITLSLETGWYFGGIYGAGLAAKYYNERLYSESVCHLGERERLFPLMMLHYTF